ncbi:translation initiation factor IF-2 [Campylobacter sp. RM6883]|uniref:Translation initiation factor IF-2 n=1 Tax=Campylobacter californiensis TaxID=1032243 RepID=A0ABD4JG18_9BACT|nr:translation initiation factor IF-2 [Campylobacter sp. RM6914]MBE2984385.1 translation initiation factor IF-2 [Campylobacter sp. RM6883]MBE2985723.1 translation initiation factor IF-2 [Campylobacter sp. RM12919]MBE2988757.1 translation initiation factor IF-2 [Campylobacter sp. RM12920]MBE2995820.1 translation initiation factor IF-2 [Campylobacter sp. RM6913]QCD50265.1 translation initiation factor IF-2 [Campylobacter sp. RM6914]
MSSVRISEIANELGYPNKEIVEKAQELGLNVKTHSNSVSFEEAEAIYEYVQTGIVPDKFKKKKGESKPKKESKIDVSKDDKPSKKPTQSSKKVETVEVRQPKETKKEDAQTKAQEPKIATKESAQVEVKATESVEAESKKEEQKPKETLADVSQKRRGLVIVKKRKEVESTPLKAQSKAQSAQAEQVNSLKSMFSSSDESLSRKKKKDVKKQPVNSKKDSSERVELLGGSDFGDIVLEDDNVVVLPDFTFKTPTPQPTQKTKQPPVFKNSQNAPSNPFEGGIQRRARKKHKKPEKNQNSDIVTSVNIPKEIRVYEFAEKLNKQPSEIIGKLFMLGMMTTKNDFLDEDAIEILADEFNVEVNIIDDQKEFDYVAAYEEEIKDDENLVLRAPVITIMGHVDHGKTSLLDYIRKSRVASSEAGGITQHVGAYMVNKNGKNITFIDTPGHEAFTAMRQRGAGVTDIVIIVVAADDGVKPQTKEAVAHAKAAGVPIIIAINKMDKEAANPDLVKTGLAELDIMPTEWGGQHEFVPISAKTGMGIDDLLEIVLLQAEILELKANPKANAKATVVESSLQKGRGSVATIIVENGTLRVGDTVVAGVAYGKIRSLLDDQGKTLKEIKPGECGVIVGLSEVAEAGETLIGVKTDKEAREYAQKKAEYLRQKELSKSTKVSLDELSAKIAEGELKTLPVIIKADVQGSLEALKASLEKLANDEVKVNVIHSGVGGITQSDVSLASASANCVILGFNIRPTGEIKEKAKESGVEIKTYNVIYNLIDDVKAILGGLMSPIIREEQLGQAQVRQVINVPKVGTIAGCMVTEGTINRGAKIRLIRDGVVVYEGTVSSLKRFKDDVREVARGYECGVGIEGYNDIRENDYIESFKETQEQATL